MRMGRDEGLGSEIAIGLVNVRSWKQSKLADITNEMKESGLGIMAVTPAH